MEYPTITEAIAETLETIWDRIGWEASDNVNVELDPNDGRKAQLFFETDIEDYDAYSELILALEEEFEKTFEGAVINVKADTDYMTILRSFYVNINW